MKFPLDIECTGMNDSSRFSGTVTEALSAPEVLPPPTLVDALPPIEGGEENLLPKAVLGDMLRVEFPRWSSDPQGEERLQLFWRGEAVAEKSWPGAVPDEDLFIMLPVVQRSEGVHPLFYRVTNWQGNDADSTPINVTIDTTGPVKPDRPAKLRFDLEVEITGVTRRYLEQYDNKVVADVPSYDFRPGDRIFCYWEQGAYGDELFHEEALTDALQVTFDGDRLEALGNRDYAVTYRLCDRAGNLSELSSFVLIKVKIEAPQLRRHPSVVGAEPGNPGRISPVNYTSGMKVRVPVDDTIDVSQVMVHWEGYGEQGSYVTSDVEPGEYWDFKIPPATFPGNFNRDVNIYYSVHYSTGDPEISEVYVLKMSTITTTKVGCAQSSGGRLSLAAVPNGADLNLPPWSYKWLAEDMRINMWMQGIDSAGETIRADILVNQPVAMDRNPVTAKLARAELAKLKLNAVFRLYAAVSFDGGETWLNFQFLELNLVT